MYELTFAGIESQTFRAKTHELTTTELTGGKTQTAHIQIYPRVEKPHYSTDRGWSSQLSTEKNYGNLLKKMTLLLKKMKNPEMSKFPRNIKRKAKKKGHHARRCSNFFAKSSEEQKKVILCADVQFFTQNQVKSKKKSFCAQMSNFSRKIK